MRCFIVILLFVFLFPMAARAQCDNPHAAMGVIIFNKVHKVMQYCDGDKWIGLWGGRGASGDSTPIGAIMAFDLTACPEGWSEYLPARGRFLRGIDNGAGNDPDGTRIAGQAQEDGIRNITGTLTGVLGQTDRAYSWGFQPGSAGAFTVPRTHSVYNTYGGEYYPSGGAGHAATFDASRVVPTAPENRPKNVAVLYCRKN